MLCVPYLVFHILCFISCVTSLVFHILCYKHYHGTLAQPSAWRMTLAYHSLYIVHRNRNRHHHHHRDIITIIKKEIALVITLNEFRQSPVVQWSLLHFTRYSDALQRIHWLSLMCSLGLSNVQCTHLCIRMHQQAYKQSQVLLWIRTGRRVCLGSNLNVAHQSNRCQCWMCNKHLGVKATNTCCSTWSMF